MNFYLKLLDENFGQITQHSNDEYYKNLVLFYVALMLFLTLFFFCVRVRDITFCNCPYFSCPSFSCFVASCIWDFKIVNRYS